MPTPIKPTCKKNIGQLDLFGPTQIQSATVVSCPELQNQNNSASCGKIIVLANFKKDKTINGFYEEVKKLTAHLD